MLPLFHSKQSNPSITPCPFSLSLSRLAGAGCLTAAFLLGNMAGCCWLCHKVLLKNPNNSHNTHATSRAGTSTKKTLWEKRRIAFCLKRRLTRKSIFEMFFFHFHLSHTVDVVAKGRMRHCVCYVYCCVFVLCCCLLCGVDCFQIGNLMRAESYNAITSGINLPTHPSKGRESAANWIQEYGSCDPTTNVLMVLLHCLKVPWSGWLWWTILSWYVNILYYF